MNILKWVLIGLIVFVLAVGGMLGAMIYLNPPPQKQKTTQAAKKTRRVTKAGNGNQKLSGQRPAAARGDESKFLIDSLKTHLDSILIVYNKQQARLDAKDKEIKKLLQQLSGKADRDSRAKDIAKTLSSMKVSKMAPILAKLDDQTVIDIYKQMSSTNRKNILLGLSGERAAKVAKKIINP